MEVKKGKGAFGIFRSVDGCLWMQGEVIAVYSDDTFRVDYGKYSMKYRNTDIDVIVFLSEEKAMARVEALDSDDFEKRREYVEDEK